MAPFSYSVAKKQGAQGSANGTPVSRIPVKDTVVNRSEEKDISEDLI